MPTFWSAPGAPRAPAIPSAIPILIAIGRKGDLTSKLRESLVSIGRVVTFVAAAVDGVKWSKDMREQLKTMQRDVTSLTDHASYPSNKITFALDAMLGERAGGDAARRGRAVLVFQMEEVAVGQAIPRRSVSIRNENSASISPVKFERWAERLCDSFLR
jgi:hypothetical protein